MYRYMISFTYRTPDNGAGFMSVERRLKRQIRSMDDITTLANGLRNRGFAEAVVLSFSLFADPASPQEAQ